ncbi:MAG: SGNH/GDSL hydrolase family protein [Planctomycetota bacterium]
MPSDASSPGRRRPLAIRLALVALGFAYTLFAAEMYLRIVAPVPKLPRYIMASDHGIRGNMPDQRFRHHTPEYEIEVRTNRRGVRADREFDGPPPAGARRIVVLGDSFGLGYGVNLEDTSLARLETRLRAAGVECEIVNLSVSGHGTAEQLVMLRNEGLGYEPDLVLVYWHESDLDDNVRSRLFTLGDDGVERDADAYLPAVAVREFLFRFRAYRWLAGHSDLYNLLRERAAGLAKRGLVAVRDLDIPHRRWRYDYESHFPRDPAGGTWGLEVASPLDAFAAHPDEMLYWERSHGHWTPLGCRLVGDALADHLLARGWAAADGR